MSSSALVIIIGVLNIFVIGYWICDVAVFAFLNFALACYIFLAKEHFPQSPPTTKMALQISTASLVYLLYIILDIVFSYVWDFVGEDWSYTVVRGKSLYAYQMIYNDPNRSIGAKFLGIGFSEGLLQFEMWYFGTKKFAILDVLSTYAYGLIPLLQLIVLQTSEKVMMVIYSIFNIIIPAVLGTHWVCQFLAELT